jgi:hypothetical protein
MRWFGRSRAPATATAARTPSAIRRRAMELARRHPEHRVKFLGFSAHHAQASAYMAENLIDAVWGLRRVASWPLRCYRESGSESSSAAGYNEAGLPR